MMIEFWLSIALMNIVALVILAAPMYLRRKSTPVPRAEFDISIYKDQLEELKRDVERGMLEEQEVDNARIEIERRILKSVHADDGVGPVVKRRSLSLPLIIIMAIAFPGISIPLYLELGSPGANDQPFAMRATQTQMTSHADASSDTSIDQMIAKLGARLEKDPDDAEGWTLFARTLTSVNRTEEAALAFEQAMNLTDGAPSVALHYGEMLVNSENRVVSAKALKLFQAAIAKDPINVRALYYIGLAKSQIGESEAALQDWVDILVLSPANASWVSGVKDHIRTVAEKAGIDVNSLKPSQKAMDLASGIQDTLEQNPVPMPLSPPSGQVIEQTNENAFILQMVERLAKQLKEEPNNLEGWQRLERSYQVLGEPEKAADATAQIKRIKAMPNKP